jgi:hypothetical protein
LLQWLKQCKRIISMLMIILTWPCYSCLLESMSHVSVLTNTSEMNMDLAQVIRCLPRLQWISLVEHQFVWILPLTHSRSQTDIALDCTRSRKPKLLVRMESTEMLPDLWTKKNWMSLFFSCYQMLRKRLNR